jgi:hypothetical protein
MRRTPNMRNWILLLTLSTFQTFVACGQTDSLGHSHGKGGKAGKGGSAGIGGNSGSAGVGGNSGSAGVGGTPGRTDGGPDADQVSCEPTRSQCGSACCPTDDACYSTAAGNGSPGSECLATRDNTDKNRIQLRQQWVRYTTPLGNTATIVYAVLSGRTQLAWPACKQQSAVGTGGFVHLIDLDLAGSDTSKHTSYFGHAKYVGPNDLSSTVDDGFCFGSEDYDGDPDYRLPASAMSSSSGYPKGLPSPMPLAAGPWNVGPAKGKRRARDFDLKTDRGAILREIDALKGEGYSGTFFYDDSTGTFHGFSALSWSVVYTAAGDMHIAIPVREAEVRFKFNDACAPNCVGAYRGDRLTTPACTAGPSQTRPAWGCVTDSSCPAGEAPATTEGYVLITELEQIFSTDLGVTLCVSYPTFDGLREANWPISDNDTSCRSSAKWNPSDPANGLPMGDWCAATNSPATVDCHDAYRSRTFHVYAGAKIKTGTTCEF